MKSCSLVGFPHSRSIECTCADIWYCEMTETEKTDQTSGSDSHA